MFQEETFGKVMRAARPRSIRCRRPAQTRQNRCTPPRLLDHGGGNYLSSQTSSKRSPLKALLVVGV